MNAQPMWVWIATIVLIVGLLAFDFIFHVRKAHTPSLREAGGWTAFYVSCALLFGVAVLIGGGVDMGVEYYAGYITELALSIDNLFVFLIIMGSFRVPRADQQKVLLFGIAFALVARGGFIALGATLINSFAWVFYLFGLILLVTAGNLIKGEATDDDEDKEQITVRLARKFIRTSDHFDGDKIFTEVDGKRVLTPMLLVMVAIGATDILFALDSIPAIFGLTKTTFIVFTATAFSLLGLRQLYFLIDGLLDRLVYLSYGLAAILGFIGVKLVLHALHENNVPFINDGEKVKVVEIPTLLSLGVIVTVLIVTVALSLLSGKGKALTTINNVRRHAREYLDLDFERDPLIRARNYDRLLDEREALERIPDKYHGLIRDEQSLHELVEQAKGEHDRYLDEHPEHAEAAERRFGERQVRLGDR